MRYRSLPSAIKTNGYDLGLRIARSAALVIFSALLLSCSSKFTYKLPPDLRPLVSQSGAHVTRAARIWHLHYIKTYSFLPGQYAELTFTKYTEHCENSSIILSIDNRITPDVTNLQREICDTIHLVESGLNSALPISTYKFILVGPDKLYEHTYATASLGSINYEIAIRYTEPGTDTASPVSIIAHELVHAALRFKNGQIKSTSDYEREEFIASLLSKCAELMISNSAMFLPADGSGSLSTSNPNIAASLAATYAVSTLAKDLGIRLGTPISSASKEAKGFIQECERYGFQRGSQP